MYGSCESNMNEIIMRQLGYGKKLDLIRQGLCPSCKQSVGEFRDDLSRQEFHISGLCQVCQDKIFGFVGKVRPV